MQPAQNPANAAEAMAMLDAAFGHLSGTDWATAGSRAQGARLPTWSHATKRWESALDWLAKLDPPPRPVLAEQTRMV